MQKRRGMPLLFAGGALILLIGMLAVGCSSAEMPSRNVRDQTVQEMQGAQKIQAVKLEPKWIIKVRDASNEMTTIHIYAYGTDSFYWAVDKYSYLSFDNLERLAVLTFLSQEGIDIDLAKSVRNEDKIMFIYPRSKDAESFAQDKNDVINIIAGGFVDLNSAK